MAEPTRQIRVSVNGATCERSVEPRLLLADFLRHELGLTGTHVGCEHGVCGACTVAFDDVPIRSCLMFAVQANGHRIDTIEGMAEGDALHPLQTAFWEQGGLQCGFCTPGFLIAARDLLARNPNPTEDAVREGLSGNLCRCTGYQSIVAAVLEAARLMRQEPGAPPLDWAPSRERDGNPAAGAQGFKHGRPQAPIRSSK
jgi:aerobic-type carbon monoxide dehydrogenase small subunit (CoxS/CutS family)